MASTLKSLKLLSDATRLRILMLLAQESLSVAELQEILAMGQSRISTQLSQMKSGGLVTDERSGKNNIYSLCADSDLMKVARLAAAEVPEITADQAALRHLVRKRKDKARAYFDELAGRFGKDYVPGRSWKAIAEALIKILNYKTVADLGAGEGTLAQLLAQRAEKVIAIDLSPKMVEFGQQLATQNGLDNLEFRVGDIESPPIDPSSLDLAILSQALHHAEHPQTAIDAAFSILKPGGRLIVLDLLQHTFEEAREMYADRWLGFSESELAGMLEKAGFSEIETVVADRETAPPRFQTLLGIGVKPVAAVSNRQAPPLLIGNGNPSESSISGISKSVVSSRLIRMRLLPISLFLSILVIGCSPSAPEKIETKPVTAAPAATIRPPAPAAADVPKPEPIPPTVSHGAPSFIRREISGVTFEGVSFDSSSHRLVVVDQPGGPGSRFSDAESAAASKGGIAAINAGFFTPEGAPLGKVIAGGNSTGSWNRASSLGSGVFYESAAGGLALARREAVSPGGQRELIQAGPMLLENGRPVSGLDTQKPAARIFLLWDGGSRWWLGRASSCTLAELASALGQGSPSGWLARHALNLDGGRSADLWVSSKTSGGPFTSRPPWNRPVRNFLVLIPR